MDSAIKSTIELAIEHKKGVAIYLSPDAEPIEGVRKINMKVESRRLQESFCTLKHGGDDIPTIVVNTDHHPNLAKLDGSSELFRVSGTVSGDSGGRPVSKCFAFMVIDIAFNCAEESDRPF